MRRAHVLILLACVVLASDALAETAIDREIARLESALAGIEARDLPEPVRPGIDVYRASLEKAKGASVPEYRLYLLRDPFVGIETLSFLARHKDAGASLDAFRRLWLANGARFAAKPPPPRGTLLQRGLTESATSRAERLHAASLPYAKAAEPWSGVYYLGEAEANLRFRDFVGSVAGAAPVERTPSRAAIDAMLDDLEAATLKFFATDITSRNAIPVSVRIKEARELLDAGRLAGAAFLAVEARAALSRRDTAHGSPRPPAEPPPAGSMQTFLLAWSDAEESPMKESLREEVSPFLGALFSPRKRQTARAAPVTVTLVRWPYT